MKRIKLSGKILRIHDYSGAYKTKLVRVENTGRNQMKLISFTVVYDGMSGVVTAL